MRRALPRIFVPLLLVAALAVGIAPAAQARSPRSQTLSTLGHERLTSLLNGSARPLGEAASVALLSGGPSLFGSFHVAGSPYHWGVGIERTRSGFVVFLGGSRNIGFGQGYEFHEWAFKIPRGDGAIGSGLRTGHIHTGQALGAFGKLDLNFSSYRRVKRQTFSCGPGQPHVTAGYIRRGTLKGSLDITPNEGTLPDMHVTHMLAGIQRSVRIKGDPCKGPSGHPTPHCYAETQVSVADKTQRAELEFYGPNQIDVSTFRTTASSYEIHDLSISAFARIAHVTSGGLTIGASALEPYFSGSLGFTKGTVTHDRGPLCQLIRTNEVWSAGTLTANLDSGVINLTGSNAHGVVVVHKRP